MPAAANYQSRLKNNAALAVQIVDWRKNLNKKWAALHFGEAKVETQNSQHIFEVEVYLDELDPNKVDVELYADGRMGQAPVRQKMNQVRQLPGVSGGYVYSGTMSVGRPAGDYTLRARPRFDGVSIPLEQAQILWQR